MDESEILQIAQEEAKVFCASWQQSYFKEGMKVGMFAIDPENSDCFMVTTDADSEVLLTLADAIRDMVERPEPPRS